MKQVQKKAVDKNKSFLDDNDRFTSFLFNMLSNSYDIRKYSYQLIAFSRKPYRWVEYSEAIGKIVYALVYFDSSMAGPLGDVNSDDDSPYFTDKDGNLKLKHRIENNPDLQKPLKDDEEIQKEQELMEAETQASDFESETDQGENEIFYYDADKDEDEQKD
jgi:DNA mismatch repair ATPase MutS